MKEITEMMQEFITDMLQNMPFMQISESVFVIIFPFMSLFLEEHIRVFITREKFGKYKLSTLDPSLDNRKQTKEYAKTNPQHYKHCVKVYKELVRNTNLKFDEKVCDIYAYCDKDNFTKTLSDLLAVMLATVGNIVYDTLSKKVK